MFGTVSSIITGLLLSSNAVYGLFLLHNIADKEVLINMYTPGSLSYFISCFGLWGKINVLIWAILQCVSFFSRNHRRTAIHFIKKRNCTTE